MRVITPQTHATSKRVRGPRYESKGPALLANACMVRMQIFLCVCTIVKKLTSNAYSSYGCFPLLCVDIDVDISVNFIRKQYIRFFCSQLIRLRFVGGSLGVRVLGGLRDGGVGGVLSCWWRG